MLRIPQGRHKRTFVWIEVSETREDALNLMPRECVNGPATRVETRNAATWWGSNNREAVGIAESVGPPGPRHLSFEQREHEASGRGKRCGDRWEAEGSGRLDRRNRLLPRLLIWTEDVHRAAALASIEPGQDAVGRGIRRDLQELAKSLPLRLR